MLDRKCHLRRGAILAAAILGFAIGENLLNSDDLTIVSIESNGTGLVGSKDFGRRFELGALLAF